MKKLWKNNLTIYTACMMVIGLLFLNVQEVAAHEAYYSNGVGVPLRWAHVDNTICYVKISTYNLSEDYTPYYNDVIYAWPNASARVSVTPTTFAESNIDLVTPTEAAWREGVSCATEAWRGILLLPHRYLFREGIRPPS